MNNKKILLCLMAYHCFLVSMEKPDDLLRLFQEEEAKPQIICNSFSDGVFSPDGSKILGQDMLKICETKRSNYSLELESANNVGSEFGSKKARWSPQGSYVYTKGKFRSQYRQIPENEWQKFFVWNAATGKLLCTIPYITSTDRAKFTQDEKFFLLKGIQRELEVYDIKSRRLKMRLGKKSIDEKISPQPPHGQFIANYQHPNTHFYNIEDFHELAKMEGKLKCFSHDGRLMVIDQGNSEKKEDNGIVLCDCNTLQSLRRFNLFAHTFRFKKDDSRLLAHGFCKVIYDVMTGKELYKKEMDFVDSLSKSFVSLDLSKVVNLDCDEEKTKITITDLDGKELQSLSIDAEIKNVRFDDEGTYAALGNFDDLTAVVSLKTGKIIHRYKERESRCFGFWKHPEKSLPLFSSDGKFLDVPYDQYHNRWVRILKLAE